MKNTLRKTIDSKTLNELVPLGRVQRWRRIKAGTFPAPIEIGPNKIAWFEDEILAWLESPPRRTYGAVTLALALVLAVATLSALRGRAHAVDEPPHQISEAA